MEKAQLTLDGKTIELPIVKGTEDEKAIDVTQLRSETKYKPLIHPTAIPALVPVILPI